MKVKFFFLVFASLVGCSSSPPPLPLQRTIAKIQPTCPRHHYHCGTYCCPNDNDSAIKMENFVETQNRKSWPDSKDLYVQVSAGKVSGRKDVAQYILLSLHPESRNSKSPYAGSTQDKDFQELKQERGVQLGRSPRLLATSTTDGSFIVSYEMINRKIAKLGPSGGGYKVCATATLDKMGPGNSVTFDRASMQCWPLADMLIVGSGAASLSVDQYPTKVSIVSGSRDGFNTPAASDEVAR